MAGKTKIQWTEQTWNPLAGCSVFSPGCKRCYAMKQAARIENMNPDSHYAGTTMPSKAGAVWTGLVVKAPQKTLLAPLRRTVPTLYFVNSMSDLFHEDVPDAWIDDIFAVMALTPRHTYQCLTKRSARMRAYMSDLMRSNAIELVAERLRPATEGSFAPKYCFSWPLPNVWLGISAEDQERADERIPDLLQTPAAVRWISAEPLLEPIDIGGLALGYQVRPGEINKLSWVVLGGESGAGARPMHRAWADDLVQQCQRAGVAVFVKQLGAAYVDPLHNTYGRHFKLQSAKDAPHNRVNREHGATLGITRLQHDKGGDIAEFPDSLKIREMPL